jgi:transcriptional regulator
VYATAHFDEPSVPKLHAFIRQAPLAAIVAATRNGFDANHIPLILDEARGEYGTLRGHVARANPIWREAPAGSEVLAIFQGIDHYISPGWYPSKHEHGKAVPTWNYTVVHARGSIEWFEDVVWLRAFLEVLTNEHEHRLPMPWQVSDAPPDYLDRMLRAIVGFEIPITALSGKWKLNQNRSAADRAGVAAALNEQGNERARTMAKMIAGEQT